MAQRRVRIMFALLGVLIVLTGVWLLSPAPGHSQRAQRGCPNASLVIDKSEGVLELRCGEERRASYLATFGANPLGPKLEEGDERTPEGEYTISSRRRTERFHRFLGISYPNASDRARSRAAHVTRLGGAIGIHGVNDSRAALGRAWIRGAHALGLIQSWGPTDGCIALMNDDVEEVYDAVRIGTPVRIQP